MDVSARRAITAMEKHLAHRSRPVFPPNMRACKPKLAYVSPLPPERSGISDYSAELLPELAQYYDIDVVVEQRDISDSWVNEHCRVRQTSYLVEHAKEYDRVLYHFGNSSFHRHMFDLLEKVPGVVVSHDFFLSGIVSHMRPDPESWATELYRAHGYEAARRCIHDNLHADVAWTYPCNLSVLQRAKGIIFHSESSRRLLQHWYGQRAGDDCTVIPLLRSPPMHFDRKAARHALGLDENAFVVCSFGMLGKNKLNHRLLDAWLASELADDSRCVLVFVGERQEGAYCENLHDTIRDSNASAQIKITDWADAEKFRNFLAAADVGVQLRTLSRGETSAAVLDCMNFGLPTIVNAHGSLADFPNDGVWKLSDDFTDGELAGALESLWKNGGKRRVLGNRAQHIVRTYHAPGRCAALYVDAIEEFYRTSDAVWKNLAASLTEELPDGMEGHTLQDLACAISNSIPEKFSQPQLLVDISELMQRDGGSGIQRVVRSILHEWLTNPPPGFRVEPVYATEQNCYRYARRYALDSLKCPELGVTDDTLEFRTGDKFIGLDLQPMVVPLHARYYQNMRNKGVRVQFVVYDLLPALMPHAFIDGAVGMYHAWLRAVASSDSLICISQAVANELKNWLTTHQTGSRPRPPDIDWFHLGSDVKASLPSGGLPPTAAAMLHVIRSRHAFLMIGTVEPRKGHAQALTAFELLWKNGLDATLVIVGKSGWLVDALSERIDAHREFGRRLFWLKEASDEYLEAIYACGTCLLAASEGEGFGLPLVEAARHKLPLIARDIPVFREVAGEHAFYFSGLRPQTLANAVVDWLRLYQSDRHPLSASMPILTWKQSADRLIELVLPNRKKPRLAFVAPLPPERTGIANYSAELLPVLCEYYDIELVTDQTMLALPSALSGLTVRSVAWFDANGHEFERIIYQIGNSPFHGHMLGLLHKHPGLVTLHDFFLSGLMEYCELAGVAPDIWAYSLYQSHGYHAMLELFKPGNRDHVRNAYPCNLDVLQTAKGVIVHSAHSQRLAHQWYGRQAADHWHVIPHLRKQPSVSDRIASRRALGIDADAFVVCSFGFVGPTKLTHRLLDTWLASTLCRNPHCALVLVGKNQGDSYGVRLSERINGSECRDRIRITGWADISMYELYLQAADISVQLRSFSRGETSGAVLDCLNYGLPTIINAHGSMEDVPSNAVWKLADSFDDAELINALETLHGSGTRREELKSAARELILYAHHPNICARNYAAAIEYTYRNADRNAHTLASPIQNIIPNLPGGEPDPPTGVASTDQNRPLQLLVDVSEISRSDLHAGIERVVRSQLSQLLRKPPAGFRVEPVYLSDIDGIPQYQYAQRFTRALLSIGTPVSEELPVRVGAGDVFYGADFCPAYVIAAGNAGIFENWKKRGVRISFLIHDLLPVVRPEFFPEQVDAQHARWLECIAANADQLICISNAVADDFRLWLKRDDRRYAIQREIRILHHGADIASSFPTSGIPQDAGRLLNDMMSAPSFLMVGTIEPRKGHLQALSAFEHLWNEGSPAKLVIVGKEGWASLAEAQRRTIPETMRKLRAHPELGKRLIWLTDISDEYLQEIYAASTCLVFASEAEGFGLPLIEAARFKKPIIARDIPVFREVAQNHAYFFGGLTPDELATAIRNWLALYTEGNAPASASMRWNTWRENVDKLTAILTRRDMIGVECNT